MSADSGRTARTTLLELGKKLLQVPDVKKHDSRFDGETCFVVPSSRVALVTGVVESVLGLPTKAAGVPVSKELDANDVVDAFGGLRANQTLYLKDMGGGVSLYVAYWPWGGGDRFTIKLAVWPT